MSGAVRMVRPGVARVQVYVGRDRNGRRRHKAKTFPASGIQEARRLAVDHVKAIQQEADAQKAASGTIAELADEWLALKARHRAKTTVEGYRVHIAAIKHEFGRLQVHQLNGRLIDAWYAKLEKQMAANTVLHYHSTLRGMLRQAERWDLVPKVVTRQATPPPKKNADIIPPSTDALNVLLDKAVGEIAVIARTIAATGMRRGEVLALARPDLNGRYLRIHRAISEVKGEPTIVKDTKGKRSRTIRIDDETADRLRAWFDQADRNAAELGGGIPADGWMFPDLDNDRHGRTPRSPSWLSHRWDHLRAGTSIGLHSIRHWHATMLIDAGVPVTVVSERLGHAQVSTTMDVYAHALKTRDERAADVIVDLLDNRMPAPLPLPGETS